jgi:hypothetical protein
MLRLVVSGRLEWQARQHDRELAAGLREAG